MNFFSKSNYFDIQESEEKKPTTTDDDTKSKKDADDKDKTTSTTEKKDDSAVATNKKDKESDSDLLHNPTRVVKAQVCKLIFSLFHCSNLLSFSND